MGSPGVILPDTHVWVWWAHATDDLSESQTQWLQSSVSAGLGVSIMSCWEVAKLAERRRLELPEPVEDWIDQALAYPGVRLLELTPRIVVESTQLPGSFHSDPADQLLVATARVLDIPIATADKRIQQYTHVRIAVMGG